MQQNRSQVIAHRGASAAAPENTLAAFQLAWAQGVDGVECDVRLSADQQIVCLHDADTGRVGDPQLVAAETAFSDLAQVRLHGFDAAEAARIPLLQTVLEQKPANSQLLIEVKTGAAIVPQLIQLLQQVGTDLMTLIVIAFDAQVVAAVKQQCPELRAYCLLYKTHPYLRADNFNLKGLHAIYRRVRLMASAVSLGLLKCTASAGIGRLATRSMCGRSIARKLQSNWQIWACIR